ncbi:uncharacterized protein [Littorina saxatilis]|uniref:uncharacterized protein n=1 Tax=Littorina saxatilis TaxID=31220 RepID=UPI0038B41C77
MEKAANKNKVRYDVRAHAADLEPGDRCLVRKVGHQLRTKVDDRWEPDIYKVLSRKEELPVYTMQREDGCGPVRTLHRNLLLPIGALDWPETTGCAPTKSEKTHPTKTLETVQKQVLEEDSDQDQETTFLVRITQGVDPRLDVSAAEFVPEEPAEILGPVIQVPEKGPEEEREDEPEVGELGTTVGEGQETSSEETSSDDQEDASSEESGTNEETETEEDSPVGPPPLRRSTRRRRPVQKLNLCHRVGLERLVNCRLSEVVTQSLVTLQDISVSDSVAREIEDALRAVIFLCS